MVALGSWAACADELEKLARVHTQLKEHQQRVVGRIQQPDQPGLVVAHGLGSGKTLTSIAAQEALGMPSTVIVPAALRENYEKERRQHLSGHRQPAHITSLQQVSRTGEVPQNPLAIVDEAHRAREVGTKAYQTLRDELKPAEKRLLLTGSPFYNRPSDLAGLMNIAAGQQVVPADPTQFKDRYVSSKRVGPGLLGYLRGLRPGHVEELNPKTKDELSGLYKKWVDYHPNAAEDFPSVAHEDVRVPMVRPQLKMYDALLGKAPSWVRAKVRAGLPPSKTESKQLNAFMTAARQASLSTRAYSPTAGRQYEPKVDEAFGRLQGELEQNPASRALVYSNYLESGVNPYRERLQAAGIPFGEFTGEVNKKTRDQLVRDYNEGNKRVMLASSAGGEGLDLKGTRLIQLLEPHWNAEKLKQVVGRGVRYKSHEHLPAEQRNVRVEHYLATRPRSGLLERLHLRKPGGGADEYLQMLSGQKERLTDQFKQLLEQAS
jgi:hypothetical protein